MAFSVWGAIFLVASICWEDIGQKEYVHEQSGGHAVRGESVSRHLFTGTLLQHPLQTYGFSPSALSSQQPRPCSGEIRRSSRSALLDALWSDSVWPISGPLLVRSGPP